MNIANIILLSVMPIGGISLFAFFHLMSKRTPLAREAVRDTKTTPGSSPVYFRPGVHLIGTGASVASAKQAAAAARAMEG